MSVPRRVGIGWLVANSLLALVRPQRAWARIPAQPQLRYAWLALVMALVSMAWGLAHYQWVNGLWLLGMAPVHAFGALAGYALAPVVAWLLAGGGLCLLSRWAGRPRSLGWCDAAAFSLWMVWVLSLGFDALHRWPGLPVRMLASWGQVGFVMHAGWWFAFPLLVIQLAAGWQIITGRSWWPQGLGFGLACLAVMRLGLRPLPEIMSAAWHGMTGRVFEFWWALIASAVVVAVATWWGRRPLQEAGSHA